MLPSPIRYSDDLETPEDDEAETSRGINAAMRDILETTSKDYGHAVRSVHAKSHGLLTATLEVHDGLPPELAQGMFATPGRHPVVMRFSTNAGDILDDAITLPRGVSLKILDVEGERLPGSQGDTTQDLILVNGPVFSAPTGKKFLGNLKLLARTTDVGEGAKKLLSAALRGANTALTAVGVESAAIRTLGGAPSVHPLGETYWSQTPFRYGAHVAKFQLVPVSPELRALTGETVDFHGRPDAIREDMNAALARHGGTWELRVQLARDLDKQPIEDAATEWEESDAPFATVATLTADSQTGWSEARAAVVDDAMSFSVWHGLAAHRPLGSVNRLRKSAYEQSTEFRGKFNGCPIHEPARAGLPA